MSVARASLRDHVAVLHRWLGLAIAGFLILLGVTGSVLSFKSDVDAWLNPAVLLARDPISTMSLSSLAALAETSDRAVTVAYIEPPLIDGRSVLVGVSASDGAVKGATYNELYMNPSDGAVLGRRNADVFQLDKLHLVPSIYNLHSSLTVRGTAGRRLLGVVAVLWMVTSCLGLVLTLPHRLALWRQWKHTLLPPWWKGGAGRSHALHRFVGLWFLWAMLTLAFTGVSLTLSQELFRPAVGSLTPLTPLPLSRIPTTTAAKRPPALNWDEAAARAKSFLSDGMTEWRLRHIAYMPERGAYRVRMVEPGFRDSPVRVREEQVYINGDTGELLARTGYESGSPGDRFIEWLFPLHTGQAFGRPGRILICVSGLLVALLSITGIVIWWLRRPKSPRARGGV